MAVIDATWSQSSTTQPPYSTHQGSLELPWWRLYQGDSRFVLEELPGNSVDCVITSPPYFSQRDYNVDGQLGMESTIQEYVSNLQAVFKGISHVLKPSGTVFLNIADTYYSAKGEPKGRDKKHKARRLGKRAVDGPGLGVPRKSQIGIPFRVALALQQDGWTIRSSIVWVKKTSIPEPSAHDRPWRKYEFVFLLSRNPKYYFNRSALRGEEDVWHIEPDRKSPSRGIHYAPYPRELVTRCIECGCPPDGVVLDPFAGGGTTLSVAIAKGHPVVGIELNPDFCKAITDNICKL